MRANPKQILLFGIFFEKSITKGGIDRESIFNLRLLVFVLSGCVVAERRYIVAPVPPPDQVEVIGVAPYPDVFG